MIKILIAVSYVCTFVLGFIAFAAILYLNDKFADVTVRRDGKFNLKFTKNTDRMIENKVHYGLVKIIYGDEEVDI